MIEPLPSQSPPPGTHPIQAFVFDTFGTVVDFYHPMKRQFEVFAKSRDVDCDAGQLAIDWRTAYLFSTFGQAVEESEFRPLREINRDNLAQLMKTNFPAPVSDTELDGLNSVWERLDPWPDAVAGLMRLKRKAIIAPLSNGNFADMVRLSRYAGLPWDIVLGASIAGFYKPHPRTYLESVSALGLEPADVCMVAAHQLDLAYAAGHGMQTAFVARPNEFGGPVKPAQPEEGVSYLAAAEVHAEGNWTYCATDFEDLAAQAEHHFQHPGRT
jgi:2-haloacid dehalogenase